MMRGLKLLFGVAAIMVASAGQVRAGILVTWEDNAGDLVIRWEGDISDWVAPSYGSIEFNVLQHNNGMHALGGPVDLLYTGTAHNWYTGSSLPIDIGILDGDSFGTSGLSNWIYMPGGYSGEWISGSLTYVGEGGLVDDFVAGSRDLGLGDNDVITFRAGSTGEVPEPASLAIFGIGALGLVAGGIRRRKKSQLA